VDYIRKTPLDFSPTTTKIILAKATFYSFILPRAKGCAAEVNSKSFRPTCPLTQSRREGEIFSAVKYKDFSVEDSFEMTFPELSNRP
jgi:hypothetical protein